MTHFSNISAKASNIIHNFFNAKRSESIFIEANKQLMVSLYNRMPNADKNVLAILQEHITCLENYMTADDINILQQEYKDVIAECYKLIDPTFFVHSGIFQEQTGIAYLPSSLIELCESIAKPAAGSSVFLPYANVGFFIPICRQCEIHGFELNPKAWAFSQIVISANNPNAKIALGNFDESMTLSSKRKYDYIFSFPPIFIGIENQKITDAIYRMITENLAVNGEFYAILPMSFCNSLYWINVRKILLDNIDEYSATIIALPAMLQPISNVPVCLVHYAKDHKGIITLADASTEVFYAHHDVAGYKERILKVQSILDTIQNYDEKYVWIGKAFQLTGNISLQPSRYLQKQYLPKINRGERLVKLSDLIEPVPLFVNTELRELARRRNDTSHINNIHVPNKIYESQERSFHLLGMKQLSNSYLNCELERKNIPLTSQIQYQELGEDCLLVGFIGDKFKVARLHGVSKEKPVALRHEITPFKLKSNLVTEDYLLRALMSKETEAQARAMSTGAIISRLSRQDLLSIQIVVPQLDRQIELCKEDTRKVLTDSDRKISESFEEFRRDMHMKKHAIGQTIFNLKNWWKILQKARKEGNGVLCDTATVGTSEPIPVSEIYNHLQDVISQLQQQINKFDRGNGLEIKNFALTDFIEEYISSPKNQSPLFRYLYDGTSHHAVHTLPTIQFNNETGKFYATGDESLDKGNPIEYVDFAPEALKIIFDNIVNNAISHGFDNSNNIRNYIKIELSSEGTDHIITISNNGRPLDKRLTEQDVFTYNKSTKNGKDHFGIGGYEIYRLMQEFGGDAVLESDPNSDFPVTYKLIFHNTNIIQNIEL